MNDRWYALRVKPRFEHLVTERLQHDGHEAFVPTYKVRPTKSNSTKTLSLPLFPEYVFCRFDTRYRFSIPSIPGVNFIAPQPHAMPVDEFEMNALRRVLEAQLRVLPALYSAPASTVYMKSGPLCGLIGLGEKRDQREWLLLPITVLRRSVAVEVNPQWIAPMAASPLSMLGSRHRG